MAAVVGAWRWLLAKRCSAEDWSVLVLVVPVLVPFVVFVLFDFLNDVLLRGAVLLHSPELLRAVATACTT